MVHFWGLDNFIYPPNGGIAVVEEWNILVEYTQLQVSTNIVGKVPAIQLHSKLLALNGTRFKHWPSLAFIATEGILSGDEFT